MITSVFGRYVLAAIFLVGIAQYLVVVAYLGKRLEAKTMSRLRATKWCMLSSGVTFLSMTVFLSLLTGHFLFLLFTPVCPLVIWIISVRWIREGGEK